MTIWGNIYFFEPNSRQHAVVVATLIASTATLVYIARRTPRATRERVEPWAGAGLFVIWLVANAFEATRSTATLRDSLPLHWCDLAGLFAAAILVWPSRGMRSLLHTIGLCLSPLAFILPTERNGPMIANFWAYFVPHAAIVMTAIYDGAVRGFRLSPADVRRAFAWVMAWVALLVPVNVLLDANYGYVGDGLIGQRAAVTAFGPWPFRILPLAALAASLMVALIFAEDQLYRLGRALRAVRAAHFDRVRVFSRPRSPIDPRPVVVRLPIDAAPPLRRAA